MMDTCRRDGHNYVPKKTVPLGFSSTDTKEVFCTKCGEVKVLVVERGATPESGTEPVVESKRLEVQCWNCDTLGSPDDHLIAIRSTDPATFGPLCIPCGLKSLDPLIRQLAKIHGSHSTIEV